MRKLASITLLIKIKSIRSFWGQNESSKIFWKKIGALGFLKCKDNDVVLQIQTKISFWVKNKPRVIV
jgi:hypothetical protein